MSLFTARAAKFFNVIPIMTINLLGSGAVIKTVNSIQAVNKFFIDEYQTSYNKEVNDFIIIGYSSDLNLAENLKQEFLKKASFKGNIYLMQMGAVVGTLTGVESLSLFFIKN